ncbi:MAG TPA: FAD-binding protein [Thermoanaerobaculia bacterium]|nr:FAD-binding protein [Thermoanaerobaculia bacterium]
MQTPDERWDEVCETDVVVLGSGAAGLSAALGALDATSAPRVTLVTKTRLGAGSTAWAQGGVAVALAADDSPRLHAEDTLRVARELADPDVVQRLTADGPEAIRRLLEWGARFDRDPAAGVDGAVALGREAGHRRHRIVHAGGDATGAELTRVLTDRARAEAIARGSRLLVEEDLFAADLLLSGARGRERVAGVLAIRERQRVAILARAVVVATGGFGQLFLHTTNPPEVTGDGIAMAARAGARLADLEFVQFHPTALCCDGASSGAGAIGRRAPGRGGQTVEPNRPRPLLTEALRGAGAQLVDAAGRRFMFDVHPDGELAPRDVVARALFERGERGLECRLDLRTIAHADPAALERRFPTAWRVCRVHGFDPASAPVPVAPAAHYAMGGVWVDACGRASLPGLWACGEAASSGVHGANRLASNSLLEALVLGRQVGASAARGAAGPRPGASGLQVPSGSLPLPSGRLHLPSGRLHLPAASAPARWGRRRVEDPALRRRIGELLWSHAGIVRSAAGLTFALAELGRLEPSLPEGPSETRNLLELGRWVAAAALLREESRGAHRRSDFPQTDSTARRTFASGDELLDAARARLAIDRRETPAAAEAVLR